MRRAVFVVIGVMIGCLAGFIFAAKSRIVQGQDKPGAGFVAVPGQVGGQDIFGPYDVVKDWPKEHQHLAGK